MLFTFGLTWGAYLLATDFIDDRTISFLTRSRQQRDWILCAITAGWV